MAVAAGDLAGHSVLPAVPGTLGSAVLAPDMQLVLSAAVLLQAPALGQEEQLAGDCHALICRGCGGVSFLCSQRVMCRGNSRAAPWNCVGR